MAKAKSKIAFDTNIWISFSLGKRLSRLKTILLSRKFQVYYCKEVLNEYNEVVSRKKFSKYLTKSRIAETLDLIDSCCEETILVSEIIHPIDKKDSFLLSFCVDANLDLLITGDPHLLQMQQIERTKIITFSKFITEHIKK